MKFLTSIISWMKTSNVALGVIAGLAVITFAVWLLLFGGVEKTLAQTPHGADVAMQENTSQKSGSVNTGVGLIAAALSTGLSAIAAGIAVAMVGSAAMGAVAERPEVMGRSIIFVGLAEGIAIYGLIISIMILGKI